MKRIAALMLSAATCISVLSGCADGAPSSSSSQKDSSSQPAGSSEEVKTTASGYPLRNITDEPVTLRFMWWGGDERNNATLEVIDQFEALYPNVSIEAEYGGNEGYKEKLVTQLYSGTSADMFQCDPAWFAELVDNGDHFIDYKDYAEYLDTSGFDESLLNQYGTYDGKIYGLPTGTAGAALVLNMTLAESLGLDYKTQLTWDSLIEMGKKVQEQDPNKYFLNVDTLRVAEQVVRPMIMQKTGHPFIIDEEFKRSFDKEQLVEVLNYVKLLYESRTVQPAQESAPFYNATETNTKWISGDFVAGLGFASTANNLVKAYGGENASFTAIQTPLAEDRLNDGFTAAPPQLMATAKTCENPEVAAAFWDYFFNCEEAIVTLKDLRSVPAMERNRNILNEKGLITEVVKDAMDYASQLNGIPEHGFTTGSEVSQIIIDMVESIAYGNSTPEDIADESIELIDDFLAQQKK